MRLTSNLTQNRHETLKAQNQLFKRIGRKCRLLQIRIEQNNNLTQIMRGIQFCSSCETQK